MEWTSTDTQAELTGIPAGDYYIIETLPPDGYELITTATEFSIDANGVVKSSGKEVTDSIVINNKKNNLTISKTDIATGKELPGAKMSICLSVISRDSSYVEGEDEEEQADTTSTSSSTVGTTSIEITSSTNDEESEKKVVSDGVLRYESGDCVPATLSDGTEATWTSGNEPKKISGLVAGTYYLVETTAPNGYTTAESIMFTMMNDGTIVDKDGKTIKDNKLVMKDRSIADVKTGRSIFVIAVIVAVLSVGLGTYYYSKTTGGTLAAGIGNINDKIRKRKIHK